MYPLPPSYEQVVKERVRNLAPGPRAHLGHMFPQNHFETDGKSYVDGTQSKDRFDTESRLKRLNHNGKSSINTYIIIYIYCITLLHSN